MAQNRMSMPLSDFALIHGIVMKHGARLKLNGMPWKEQTAKDHLDESRGASGVKQSRKDRIDESIGAKGSTYGAGARAKERYLKSLGLNDWGRVPVAIQNRMAKGYVTDADINKLKKLGINKSAVRSVFSHREKKGINPKTKKPYYQWTAADHASASAKDKAHYDSPEGRRLRAQDSANGHDDLGKTWKNQSMARLRSIMLKDERINTSNLPLVAEYAEKAYRRGFNGGKKVNSSPLNLNLKM